MPVCVLVILVSCLFIIRAILQIRSAGGRAKTFSTCASHFTAVSLFFGTLIFTYLRDNSGHSSQEDRVVSVFYTTVIPMLNPLIYSLRNKEVKEALRKVLERAELC
ncbi:olfactory receptor 9Q2-like [Neomonachus schauinslandi]|uniref:Olfactory receptor 9Q2-like n=1 Tax=Neomonachus schauinslandi TaxID=29088 RepID=A0A2Y9GUG7_NEOSC|nr:olfactory receptor 9Q2-like [Neomonachus schauinslandi]